MDVIVEYHMCQNVGSADEKKGSYNHVKAGIGSVNVKLTNKEIQQLKDFADNIIKYHDQISYEIQRELRQIYRYHFGNNFFDQNANRGEQSEVSSTPGSAELPPERLGGLQAPARAQSQSTMADVIGQLGKMRSMRKRSS